jgi:hypothetical protein
LKNLELKKNNQNKNKDMNLEGKHFRGGFNRRGRAKSDEG